jgi:predicted SnoaL-like aldol condensation-catalyzing enzyme
MSKPYIVVLAATLALGGCSASAEKVKVSSQTEANRAAIKDYARLLMVERKPNEAFAKYFAPDLIQHDPFIGDGNGGDEAFLEARKDAAPEKYDDTDKYVNVIHNFLADGDLVAMKSHVFTNPTDPGREFVDIWRVKDGKFVEHWDVIMPIDTERANKGAVGCGVGVTYDAASKIENTIDNPACGEPDGSGKGDENKRTILAYMKMGLEPGRLIEAIETYVAEDFTQHSARIPPGRQGLIDYMVPRMAERNADNRNHHFARMMGDGDMVLVHRWVTRDSEPLGKAFIDVFRLKDGKITDHWDLFQDVPPFSVSGRSMAIDGPMEEGRHKGPAPLE